LRGNRLSHEVNRLICTLEDVGIAQKRDTASFAQMPERVEMTEVEHCPHHAIFRSLGRASIPEFGQSRKSALRRFLASPVIR
jgi:hypothetical protein